MGVFRHWPNRITAIRFGMSALLFWILAVEEPGGALGFELGSAWRAAAFWLFLVTAATDVLDGWLARRGNCVTAFGRIADPFVDKVLVIGTMVLLLDAPALENASGVAIAAGRDYFAAWMVVVVAAREFLITAIRGYVESLGAQLPADWMGKVKMAAQCTALSAVLGLRAFDFGPDAAAFWHRAAQVFVWLTLVATIGSCLNYLVKTRRFLLEQSAG
jgi:CDP-diacylglycerol--glycerol-3-phosphate 3-phosphatidyltransferase